MEIVLNNNYSSFGTDKRWMPLLARFYFFIKESCKIPDFAEVAVITNAHLGETL